MAAFHHDPLEFGHHDHDHDPLAAYLPMDAYPVPHPTWRRGEARVEARVPVAAACPATALSLRQRWHLHPLQASRFAISLVFLPVWMFEERPRTSLGVQRAWLAAPQFQPRLPMAETPRPWPCSARQEAVCPARTVAICVRRPQQHPSAERVAWGAGDAKRRPREAAPFWPAARAHRQVLRLHRWPWPLPQQGVAPIRSRRHHHWRPARPTATGLGMERWEARRMCRGVRRVSQLLGLREAHHAAASGCLDCLALIHRVSRHRWASAAWADETKAEACGHAKDRAAGEEHRHRWTLHRWVLHRQAWHRRRASVAGPGETREGAFGHAKDRAAGEEHRQGREAGDAPRQNQALRLEEAADAEEARHLHAWEAMKPSNRRWDLT